tara:strand:- start:1099 stop:1455 length:357 start_codon:yes stop_codon:yes gene_type:complete
MSKLGCSLNEAYGETWNAGPTYYQTTPENFRVQMDPYSSNVFTNKTENFVQDVHEEDSSNERIRMLEAKVESMNSQQKKENFSVPNLGDDTVERIDNVVRFALISILISNFFDLMYVN